MENENLVKGIMHEFIQSGDKTVKDCFKQICVTMGLQKEYNVLVYVEKIAENNSEIREFYAKHMYDRAASLCEQNSKLYNAINQELKVEQTSNTTPAQSVNTSTGAAQNMQQMNIR